MRERLLNVPEAARTEVRLSRAAARQLDPDAYEALAAKIEEWVDLGGHELAESHPEWSRSTITTTDNALDVADRIHDLHAAQLPAARDALYAGLDEVGVARPESVQEWQRAADFLSRVARTHEICHPEIYALDLEMTQRAIAPLGVGWRKRLVAHVFSHDYRLAKRAVRAAVREQNLLRDADLLTLVMDARGQRDEWTARQGDHGAPRVPRELGQINKRMHVLIAGLNDLKKTLVRDDLDKLHHEDLGLLLARLIDTRGVAARLPRIRELEAAFREVGIEDVIVRIGQDIPAELAARAAEYAWLQRVLGRP